MWLLKIKVYDETGTFSQIARKYQIPIYGYMINYFSKGGYAYFNLAIFLNCNEKIKALILNELTHNKRVHKIEDQGNFIICQLRITENLETKRQASLFYNPSLIQVKPFLTNNDGWEELEYASFDREPLEKILSISEKSFKQKIIYLKQSKIQNLGVLKLFPELTNKQREILDLAINNEYYSYPRKTDIKKLSKTHNISYSTFQEHLRRAENKLMPFMAKKQNP